MNKHMVGMKVFLRSGGKKPRIGEIVELYPFSPRLVKVQWGDGMSRIIECRVWFDIDEDTVKVDEITDEKLISLFQDEMKDALEEINRGSLVNSYHIRVPLFLDGQIEEYEALHKWIKEDEDL